MILVINDFHSLHELQEQIDWANGSTPYPVFPVTELQFTPAQDQLFQKLMPAPSEAQPSHKFFRKWPIIVKTK